MQPIAKEKPRSGHWFINEVHHWRSIASSVWSFWISFPIFLTFLFLFSLDLYRHVYVIYDFLNSICTLQAFMLCLLVAASNGLLTQVHARYYAVTALSPVTRFGFIINTLKPRNLFHNLISGLYGGFVGLFVTRLIDGNYSNLYKPCDLNDEDGTIDQFCLNESWFIVVLFGFTLGVTHSMKNLNTQQYTLKFLKVQETRFLFIKCKLSCMISNCAGKSAFFLRQFIIIYYLIGFVVRDATAFILGVLPSQYYLLSIWRIWSIVPVVWNLWLMGILILLMMEVSWQLFNVFNVQNFPFLLDSVFPEDKEKLLFANLDESNPLIIQYLAFQCLSLISKNSESRRQRIFSLSIQAENGRPVWWNKVVDECLARIEGLSNAIDEHQLQISRREMKKQIGPNPPSLYQGDESKLTSPLNSSVLRRREVSGYAEVADASCFNASSQTAVNSANITLSSSNVAVPTPRLWTSPVNDQNFADTRLPGQAVENVPMGRTVRKSRFHNFAINVKSIPVVSYFLTTVTPFAARNFFHDHILLEWVMQSLSYLCVASVTEDSYGVVQTRLHEIISALIDLLTALEKMGNVSSTEVGRLRTSLIQETRSSLRRITDAFGTSLKSISLGQEYRYRVETIMNYEE